MASVPAKNRTNERCPDCKGHGVIYLHRDGWDDEHPEQAEYTCAMCCGAGFARFAVTAVAS